MIELLRRLQARWRIVRNSGDELNRRARVEEILFDVAKGKRDLLSREECRELGLKLGTPKR